jgi:transcriptional regulator with XRE-family HTH domain
MITGRQIRAARALLDWDAVDLAERAGTTREPISNIETGSREPRGDTLKRIEKALSDAGVVFSGDTGLDLRKSFRLFEGSDCYLRLLNEIYHTLNNAPGSEVLSIGTDDSVSPPEVVAAIQRWHDAKLKCRFLSHEKAKRFDFPVHEYRLMPARLFKNSVVIVYADYVATLRGLHDSVLVVQDKDQADMMRGLFEVVWSHSATLKARR